MVDDIFYYTFSDIKSGLAKLNNLFVVTAETKIINSEEYFHYTKAKIYLNLKFNKFIEMIEQGFIQYDIRIGMYKSGINIGKPHDHGSGFRVSRKDLQYLYNKFIEI